MHEVDMSIITIRRNSQIAILSTVFLGCVSFSIVMPTLWPYLQSLNATPSFFALVVSLYSVGEGAGALLFGALSTRVSTLVATLGATALGTVGSLLYIGAQPVSQTAYGRYLVLAARVLHGMWSGAAQAIQQAYCADVLPKAAVTPMIVRISSVACLGFVFGPALGFLFSQLPPFVVLPLPGHGAGLRFDELTAAGYFVLLSTVACIIIYATLFDEQGDRADTARRVHPDEQIGDRDVEEAAPLLTPGGPPKLRLSEHATPVPWTSLSFCAAAFFIHFYGFAIQETVTTPLVQKLYNWEVTDVNALFTAAGVASLVAFALLDPLTRVCDDRTIVTWSFAVAALGYALLMPFGEGLSETRFLAAFAIISLVFPVGRACAVSLYTKLLPMHMQGVGQGVILAVGAVARIISPFFAVRAVSSSFDMTLVFGMATAVFLSFFLVGIALFPKLKA